MLTEEELIGAFLETNEAEPLAEDWPWLERFGRAVEKLVEKKNGINIPVEIAADAEHKPPLGIMPEKLWKECRVWDLIGCLSRAHDERSYAPEPMEKYGAWLDELRRLLHDILYK
jgi:hypothetical protein